MKHSTTKQLKAAAAAHTHTNAHTQRRQRAATLDEQSAQVNLDTRERNAKTD